MKILMMTVLIGCSLPMFAAENTLDAIHEDIQKHLTNSLLLFWTSPKLVDTDGGGFLNMTDPDGNPLGQESKTLMSHLRILYVYANAISRELCRVPRYGKDGKGIEKIYGRQLKYMVDTFWDKDKGWWVYETGPSQKNMDGRLKTLTNIYALYILSELYHTINDLDALWLADKTFEYLNGQWDEKNVGYFSEGDSQREKDAWMNICALMALSKYATASYSENARRKAIALHKAIHKNLLNPKTGHGYISFNRDWNPKADEGGTAVEAVVYAHDMEALWYMIEAGKTLGIDSKAILPWLEKGASAIMKDAMLPSGAVYVSTEAKARKTIHFWGQAEAMHLFYRMYELTGRKEYLDNACNVKEWTFKHIVQPNGFWRPMVNEDGSECVRSVPGAESRGGFHETRMLVSVLDAIDRIQFSKLRMPYPRQKLSITGTFLMPHDAGYRDYQWTRKHFLMMKDVGINLVIITWLGHPSKVGDPGTINTYYPSHMFKQFTGFTPKNDPFRNIFKAAEELDMKVMSAAEPNGGNQLLPLERDKKISREVWDLYGRYKSFYGWYFANEYSDRFWKSDAFLERTGSYYKGMVEHLHHISGKPTAFAPYLFDIGPEKQAEIWDRVLKKTKIDIIMMQDGVACLPTRMSLDRAKRYYYAMHKVCKDNGVRLWTDLEVFAMAPLNQYKLDPGNCYKVVDQIEAEEQLVENIVVYQFSEMMATPEASLVNNREGRELYERYRMYFLKKNKLSVDLAVVATNVLPRQGGAQKIEVSVKNIGNHQVGQTIQVALYDNAFDKNGKLIDETFLSWLPAGGLGKVVFTLPSGMKKVFAVVDPENNIYFETSKTNNTASAEIK